MLEPAPVRTYEEVRLAIDSKLGSATGVEAIDAAKQLTSVEHVVWVLDNLLASLFDFRLHIWDQSFAQGAYDGPRTVAAIAHMSRSVDPVIADLLLWTVEWVRTRGVPMTVVVPELWALRANEARRFLIEVAERWPENLDPASVIDPPAYRRPERREVAMGFTAQGAHCAEQCALEGQPRDDLFRTVALALWKAGATDEELETFFVTWCSGSVDEVEVLCRYVSFDGDGGDPARKTAVQKLIKPEHPLTTWLGEEPPSYGVLLVDTLEEVETRLGDWFGVRIEGLSLTEGLKRALRSDPDVMLIDGSRVDAQSIESIAMASLTGHLVFISGRATGMEHLSRLPAEVQVIDRRRS